MKIPFSPPDISDSEILGVGEVLRSGWITTGPCAKKFENRIADFCETKKAVALNSATAALELILRILGIGPGDEVITSAYTYTASASPVLHCGAKLILADTAADSYEMDYGDIADLITAKTKATIPVDLGGICCDYDKIFKIVNSKKALFRPANKIQEAIGRIAVVADSAHAFGAVRKGKKAGNIADFSCFSFHAVKNLTTAEGGAAVWRGISGIDDEDIYREFQLLSLHGQSKDALSKTAVGSWEYDIVYPAYKCNMTDIMAALGLRQLERYPKMLARRREIIKRYDEAFRPLGILTAEHYGEDFASSGHLYLTRIPGITSEQRNEIICRIGEKGIAANVHYKPLPMMTAYKSLGFDIKDYPNAYAQFACEITLPLHTKLTDGQVSYICEIYADTVRDYIADKKQRR